MKRILVYGDSITWGRIPGTTERYAREQRFTGVMERELGEGYEVMEEGLRARMLSGENPHFANRDGLQQFGPIFGSHVPLDLVIIMLGTNDTNAASAKSAEAIAADIGRYKDAIESWSRELDVEPPQLLLVSPPLVIEAHLQGDPMFIGAEQKTRALPVAVEAIATQIGADFYDASFVCGSELEGVHLDEESNRLLGAGLANTVRDILQQ